MSTMVRVVVRPDDVEGVPLGGKSAAGTVNITAEYDRTVELANGTIRYAGVRTPLHKSTVLDYWQIDVIAADAADIVRGAGCCVTFRVEVTPRHGGGQGRGHGQAVTTHAKTIQVITADGTVTNLASKASVVPVPEGAVLLDPAAVTKAGEAWDKADNAQSIATGAVTAAEAAQHAAEIAEGAAFATVDSGTAALISNPTAGPQTRSALMDRDSVVNVKDYGVILDGTTDNAATLQAAANAARDLGRALYIPAGNLWWSGVVTAYTSIRCEGRLVVKPSTSNTLTIGRTLASSTIPGTSLGGLTEGSQTLTGTGGARGSIELVSSEELIKRDGSGGAAYTKREISSLAADGTITPALANTYATPASLTATVYPYEAPITLDGIKCVVTGTGTLPHDHLIQVKRDNVTINGISCQNDTTIQPTSAIRVQSCTGVTFNSPRINGFDGSGVGYGIAIYQAANITINDPGITRCRHSISGTYNKAIQVNGGSILMLDQHWCNGLTVDRATISTPPGSSLVQVAGSDVTLRDCTLIGGRNIIGIREDTPEMSGSIVVQRCTWRPSSDATLWAVGYSSTSNATAFSWGRTLRSPSRVDLADLIVDRTGIGATLTQLAAVQASAHNFAREHWRNVRISRVQRLNAAAFQALVYELNSAYTVGPDPASFTVTNVDMTRTPAGDTLTITNPSDTAGVGCSVTIEDCPNAWIKLPTIGITATTVRRSTVGRLFQSAASAAPSLGRMLFDGCEFVGTAFNGVFTFDTRSCVYSGSITSPGFAIDARVLSVTGGVLNRVGTTGAPTRADGYKNATYYA